jgi:hypothetical protein
MALILGLPSWRSGGKGHPNLVAEFVTFVLFSMSKAPHSSILKLFFQQQSFLCLKTSGPNSIRSV